MIPQQKSEVVPLLKDDPFSTSTSRELFEAIDELRKWRADQSVGLPQLLIVRKQFAGKLSLLQSLTDIPFPVGDGLSEAFASVINEVKVMLDAEGVPKLNQRHFSSMVLKVDFSRPDRSHFVILDVPGVFTNCVTTTDQETEGVEKILISYMKKKPRGT
ncbi:hypothetical protein BJ878DRAFT_477125 [Calycina marina]|uniref:Uncharacterized protein n=1 Tax=Calycina marina TaxID=1763456 RepID=A0A9P8CIE0_9HELO|nr:hypothetical protein BJ878DRAFT_477125 [Calycina marina]